MPTYTIVLNADVEGAIMVGKFLEQNNLDIGYNDTKGLLFFFTCSLHPLFLSSSLF
jgi:hypothetical protein